MNYGRDYGNRNFLDRAAHTVRGWLGNRGGHSGYDDGYRGGMNRGGWDEGYGGYREMGDVSYRGGMDHGYGATNWTGRNPDWSGGGWGRGGAQEYRTGGYQPQHGSWDVDWDDGDRTMPQGGMYRGGMMGSGGGRYDRGYMGGRGMQGGMGRGMNRGYDRDDYRRDYRQGGGMNAGGMGYGTGMGPDADLGDALGGTIGNYGAYGGYGIERFRSGSAGGVPTGQYWTGYGHGGPYRG